MTDNTQAQSSDVVIEQVVQTTENTQEETNAKKLQKLLTQANEEAKLYRQKLAEQKRHNEEAERKRLEAEGNFKQLAEQYKTEMEMAKSGLQKATSAFAAKTISDQVAMVAKDLGCVDVDVVNNLIDMNTINVDERFNVDSTSLKEKLEEIRTKKPYLFQKPTPKIADVSPGMAKKSSVKSIESMSAKEIEEILLNTYKKKG